MTTKEVIERLEDFLDPRKWAIAPKQLEAIRGAISVIKNRGKDKETAYKEGWIDGYEFKELELRGE